MNSNIANEHLPTRSAGIHIQAPFFDVRKTKNTGSVPRAPQTVHVATNFNRWQVANYGTSEARENSHCGKNIYYERTPTSLIMKIQKIPSFEESDKHTGVFRTYLKSKHLFAYAFKFENGFWYCLLTPVDSSTAVFSDQTRKYYHGGWTGVAKRDLSTAVIDLFKRRTTIIPTKFPEHIRKYINFNGQGTLNPVVDLEELLKTFIRDVERWEFDISPHKLMITFLRKVGVENADFVERNAHKFNALYAKTRRDRFGNHRDERAIKQLTCGNFDTQGFVTYDYDNYSMFISKNQRHYLNEAIDHIMLDATGSLPSPYSQLINFIYYDKTNRRFRYLGSFLLKETGLHIDTNLWEEILSRLDAALPFKSISVDGEKAMLRALAALGKIIWGCHAHYIRSVNSFATSKERQVRADFLYVAKYFMFMNGPDEIFRRLSESAKFDGEMQLISHIRREYLDLNYFGYSGNLQNRDVLAHVTTSPVEGINGSLKYYLRQDKSPITIIKFIADKSQYPMNIVQPVSIYQTFKPGDSVALLIAMENGRGSDKIAGEKFAKRGIRMERWRSAKLKTEKNAAIMRDHYNREKTIAENIATSKKIQKMGRWTHDKAKYKFLRTIGEDSKAIAMRLINRALIGRADEDEYGTEIVADMLQKFDSMSNQQAGDSLDGHYRHIDDDPFVKYILDPPPPNTAIPQMTRPDYSDDDIPDRHCYNTK